MPFAETAHLVQAADAVGALIIGLTSAQWAAATPCEHWDVAEVVEHLVDVNNRFATELGASSAGSAIGYNQDNAHAQRYRDSTAELVQALRALDVAGDGLPTQLRARLALRIADLLVHGWDIAVATGQTVDLPGDLCEHALEFARGRAGALQRGGQFGAPQPVSDDAPAIDRLAALTGRAVPGELRTHSAAAVSRGRARQHQTR